MLVLNAKAYKMPHQIHIDPLPATSLRVVPKFNEIELASATGFIVEQAQKYYLITNWHVVTGRNADTDECLDKKYAGTPNRLSIWFHTKGNLGSWTSLEIPLFTDDNQKTWLEHPLGRAIDVVAITLSPELIKDIHIYTLDLELANVDILAMPALPVSVIGYPFGISAGENWPIWKTGHIASDPEIDFQTGKPAFLIDATTRSGMSGSPVVLRLDSYSTSNGLQVISGGIKTRFMGIYSGRVHKDSELGRVWRPFVLSELLQRRLIFNEVTRRVRPGRLALCPCGSGQRFKECCGSIT